MGDPVPAIREEDATGETAAIYADIRATLGVPVVNLVWRHLATMPDALPWAWGCLRPLYASGAIAAEAAALRGGLRIPEPPRLPEPALRACGIDPVGEAGIGRVLAAYDRSNSMNLLALSALLMRLDGVAPAPARSAPTAAPGAVEGALPKLLTLDEMAPSTAALVRLLNGIGERGGGRILASMYRHLAHWPGFLALAWAVLAPLEAEGRLATAIEDGLAAARRRSAGLLGRLGADLGEPPPSVRTDLRDALDGFTTHAIGKMVVIGAVLRRAMPAGTTAAVG